MYSYNISFLTQEPAVIHIKRPDSMPNITFKIGGEVRAHNTRPDSIYNICRHAVTLMSSEPCTITGIVFPCLRPTSAR
uniref:Uncharacterized protein n=1 Tax=Arundo donax TaxID=35708 RepID=A0A0A9B5P2_ARUDO